MCVLLYMYICVTIHVHVMSVHTYMFAHNRLNRLEYNSELLVEGDGGYQ